jgi:hypothetical protein
MTRKILQLSASLSGVVPPVRRRVLVPGGYTLDRLHRVLQLAFGWHGHQPHSFTIGGQRYGEPDPDAGPALRDELDVRVDAVLGKGSRFRYTCRLDDRWDHDVTVEDVVTAEPGERYPLCLDGDGVCPPAGPGSVPRRTILVMPDDRDCERPAPAGGWADRDAFDPERLTTLLRWLA